MTSPSGNSLFIVERILRDRDGVWRQIILQQNLPALLRQMLLSSVVSLACYGAVLGSTKGWQQVLASTVKLPVLFLATLAICLPTLYLFNLVFGARLMMSQAVSLIMVCITVISVLTLAFAPISLFFRITAQSYAFFKLLNITILVLTAIVGLRFLTAGMRALNDYNEAMAHAAAIPMVKVGGGDAEAAAGNGSGAGSGTEAQVAVPAVHAAPAAQAGQAVQVALPAAPPVPGVQPAAHPAADAQPRHPAARLMTAPPAAPAVARPPASMTLLYVWILLFGFVGTQLAWTLRPFFGSPGEPFEIFRNIQGTFYSDVLRTIGDLLGGS